MLAYQSSSVSSSIGLLWPLPALLIRMSTRPNCGAAASAVCGRTVGRGDITGDRENLAPEATELVGGALEIVGAPAAITRSAPSAASSERNLPADSLAPAGDDGNPFPQAEFHGPERTQDRRSPIGDAIAVVIVWHEIDGGLVGIDDAKAAFDRRRAAWLAEDLDGYIDCWVDDMVIDVPGRTIAGKDGVTRSRRARSSGRGRWRSTSTTWRSTAMWCWPTGRSRWRADTDDTVVKWRGMSACQLRDGQIVWWREYYEDPVGLRAARTA